MKQGIISLLSLMRQMRKVVNNFYGILEFLRIISCYVIPQPLWGISIENFRISLFFCGLGGVFFLEILEFPKIRHCEALKKPKQSRSKFRLKFRLKFPKPRVIPRLDRGISL